VRGIRKAKPAVSSLEDLYRAYGERERQIRAETADPALLKCRLLLHQLMHYEAMLMHPELDAAQRTGIEARLDWLARPRDDGTTETRKWVVLVSAVRLARETNHTFAADGKDLILRDAAGKSLYRGAETTAAKVARALAHVRSLDLNLASCLEGHEKEISAAIEAHGPGRPAKGQRRAGLWTALAALGQCAELPSISPESLRSLYKQHAKRAIRRVRQNK